MGFPTPPRGSGRHHWSDRGEPSPYRASSRDTGRYHPDDEDFPTDPSMPFPLDEVPRQPARPGPVRPPPVPAAQVVVPRVYVEPDEMMDRLRARALRFAITRDVIGCLVGLYLLGQWLGLPLWRALGF